MLTKNELTADEFRALVEHKTEATWSQNPAKPYQLMDMNSIPGYEEYLKKVLGLHVKIDVRVNGMYVILELL